MENEFPSYRSYWIAWLILLVLTLLMFAVEGAGLGKVAVVLLLSAAAAVKLAIIGGWYMHLRYERFGLVVTVAVGGFATLAVLFLLIASDGLNIGALSQ